MDGKGRAVEGGRGMGDGGGGEVWVVVVVSVVRPG